MCIYYWLSLLKIFSTSEILDRFLNWIFTNRFLICLKFHLMFDHRFFKLSKLIFTMSYLRHVFTHFWVMTWLNICVYVSVNWCEAISLPSVNEIWSNPKFPGLSSGDLNVNSLFSGCSKKTLIHSQKRCTVLYAHFLFQVHVDQLIHLSIFFQLLVWNCPSLWRFLS